ncbi:unnamed protein product [Dovyalis caffra]|uniref:PPPDE domain-containing protein n=1 Tax=Dovyalis caffra TaxID=77055 RepID=A0AAV1SU44_9ROSI|nr:unnamed protein product [Dovyalis caffra]
MRLFPLSSSSSSSSSSEKEQSNGGSSSVMLYLNIYDLTPINNYLYWFGLGIFHSGIEVHDMEYGFGAHEYPTSGVFEVEPKSCPGFIFRRSVVLGSTNMSRSEFRSFMEHLSAKYHGDSYHLIAKNCNHFTDEVCKRLTGKPIPGWVNRMARLEFLFEVSGSFCNCLLPESIQITAVRHLPDHPTYSGKFVRLIKVLSFVSSKIFGRAEGTSACGCLMFLMGIMFSYLDPNTDADDDDDGLESVASSITAGSEEEGSNHHLLTSPNGEVAFLKEKPMRLARELL